LNSNPGYFGCFTPICSYVQSCLLVSWCVGDRCDIAGSDEDRGRSRRPGVEDQEWSTTCRWVSWFGPRNRQLWFSDLSLKITVRVSWFGPQNQVGDGLSIAPQNRREEDGVEHASRSSNLLRLEASWVRVSQFASKLAEE
jgi:hypothetical protein